MRFFLTSGGLMVNIGENVAAGHETAPGQPGLRSPYRAGAAAVRLNLKGER